ncbi:WXG100 family type VII secretion target [Nocardioides sp. Iso805N]|uniref:WXG100 family type VII secretion target n=1 Tax=Nocardioides sp. Iso805N TaxID=1283287 RepID=UPI000360D19E|nr:WXG100 family type VII secretion target [Nocardioides sp. Iso805N]
MTRFKVDLAELDSVVRSLDAFGATFATQLGDLETAISALQKDWLGDAADAQSEVHRRIAAGAKEMHAAVVELHAAARKAHSSYSGAAAANVAIWRQVR